MIKTLLITTLLSTGTVYEVEMNSYDECVEKKEHILKSDTHGNTTVDCIMVGEKKEDEDTVFERNLRRRILTTFDSILTQILIDYQREGVNR